MFDDRTVFKIFSEMANGYLCQIVVDIWLWGVLFIHKNAPKFVYALVNGQNTNGRKIEKSALVPPAAARAYDFVHGCLLKT